MSPRLVILDRDGVINEDSDAFVKTADEWRPIPGSLEAIARLNQAGYRVVVCTNQSGIARGLMRSEDLHAMHIKMDRLLAQVGGQIDAVFYCPDAPDSVSQCRKPAPGMLHDVAARLHVDLRDVPVVGDSERDLLAAAAAGASPYLVRTGKGRWTERKLSEPVQTFDDLAAFVDHLLASCPVNSL
jgi:D-glycero-D-manno-heptose 1,7-bisphosphate phosphatase